VCADPDVGISEWSGHSPPAPLMPLPPGPGRGASVCGTGSPGFEERPVVGRAQPLISSSARRCSAWRASFSPSSGRRHIAVRSHRARGAFLGRQIPEAPLAEPRRQPCAGTVERAALILPDAKSATGRARRLPTACSEGSRFAPTSSRTDLRKDEVKARTLVHQEGQPQCVESSRCPAMRWRRPLALKDRAAVIQERLKGRPVERQSPPECGEAHLRAALGWGCGLHFPSVPMRPGSRHAPPTVQAHLIV